MAAEKKSGGTQISGDDSGRDCGEEDENKDENARSKSVVDSPTSYIIGIQSNSSFRFLTAATFIFLSGTPSSKNRSKTFVPPSPHLVIGRYSTICIDSTQLFKLAERKWVGELR
jgi:hypothetical protein